MYKFVRAYHSSINFLRGTNNEDPFLLFGILSGVKKHSALLVNNSPLFNYVFIVLSLLLHQMSSSYKSTTVYYWIWNLFKQINCTCYEQKYPVNLQGQDMSHTAS